MPCSASYWPYEIRAGIIQERIIEMPISIAICFGEVMRAVVNEKTCGRQAVILSGFLLKTNEIREDRIKAERHIVMMFWMHSLLSAIFSRREKKLLMILWKSRLRKLEK
ncbi:MAG: hypothetical protein ACMUIS_03805 [bacterium]